MLENYRKALDPDSLLEVVPKEILQSLMQSFFFGQRAGIVLLYDVGLAGDGRPVLERLDPIEPASQDWRARFQNFNPFCAKFREKPERNAMCEECDLRHAHMNFAGTQTERRYVCHMGLIDITLPIKIGGKIRAVVSAGQKILRDDRQIHTVQQQTTLIRNRIREKAPDIAFELEAAVDSSAQDAETVQAFEDSFVKFAETFQNTVEAFIKARRGEAEREALLEINEELGRSLAEDVTAWTQSSGKLFQELEDFTGGRPVWMLQRRGSRYQCLAASPLGANALDANILTSALITSSVEKMERVVVGSHLYRELVSKLRHDGEDWSVVRIDTPIGGSDVTSLVLVAGTHLASDLESFMVACAKALAYPVGVAGLFRRLEKQQNDFALAASFTGHHLKTPLQVAIFSMREAILVVGNSPGDHAERQKLLREAQHQISKGLADALRLQAFAMPPSRERFRLYPMLEGLVEDMRPLARDRGITIQLTEQPPFTCEIYGDRFHIRIGLYNLLNNAIKYSFEDKRIDIRVHGIASGHGGQKRTQDIVCVEIEDVGVGFQAEQKEQLFNLGSRLEEFSGKWARAGAGIGLLQSKDYIEAAGGSLDIESEALPSRSEHSGSICKVVAIVHLPISA